MCSVSPRLHAETGHVWSFLLRAAFRDPRVRSPAPYQLAAFVRDSYGQEHLSNTFTTGE
jgi:hypothetical protein